MTGRPILYVTAIGMIAVNVAAATGPIVTFIATVLSLAAIGATFWVVNR